MTAVITWTADDVASLKAAIASGVLTVRYDGPPGRTITYQSLSAMREALAAIVSAVGDTAGTRTRYRFGATRKGLS